MKSLFGPVGSTLLLVFVAGAACSKGGGGSSGMSIVDCNLSCSDSASNPGVQVSCGVTDVFVNPEITIKFSSPIDPNTLSNNTFQVTELGTGKTPAGSLTLDPDDPRVLIYRPQLTFDSAGNPIFGFTEDQTYILKVPGTRLEPSVPHIRSTLGTANTNTLRCALVASQNVNDAKPGAPRVTVTVDTVTGYDGNGEPNAFDLNVPAQGAENVHRATPIRMVFDDVMNPATLANPVTGFSSHILPFVDANGDIADTTDWVPLRGTFRLTIDQSALRTTVIFTPSGGLPSAGSDVDNPRKIVVVLSPQIADLGGNLLINAQTVSFTPERIEFDPIVIEELFADGAREDAQRTGSTWGAGITAPGTGGGSGRLGDLIVLPGVVVELNTDFEDFSALTDPEVFNPINIIDPPATLEVIGGVFEFARLRIDAGGILRFRGTRPARLMVRGEAIVQGVIDVSGGSGTLQVSTFLVGGPGGSAGPNGGAGGRGGSRPDGSAFVAVGGEPNPGAGPTNVLDPATYIQVNGIDGGGIPFPNANHPTPTFVAGGTGGLGWPQPSATHPSLHMPQDPTDIDGLQVDRYLACSYIVPAAPGSGGAHAMSGLTGDVVAAPNHNPLVALPDDTPGGDSGELQIDDTVRSLLPELGYLRGGAGGGGGGGHIQLTDINAIPLQEPACATPFPGTGPLQVANYFAHSSAGGGGGGGGLQLAAGRRIKVDGIIDASGGVGGSGTFPPPLTAPSDLAQAGGGGGGGALLIQSQLIEILGVPSRLRVSGGGGGEGAAASPALPSVGGHGGPGFLRMESSIVLSVDDEEFKVEPSEADLQEIYGPGATMEQIFTTAEWEPPVDAPSGWSGAQSCWIRPTGSFFRLGFEDDTGGLGWDMRLRIAGLPDPQSYRGENDLFPGMTLEQVWGSDLGSSPVIVRFQGARAISTLVDPCVVPEVGSSPLAVGSMTDWVRHPSELADFHSSEALTPNIFRFVILWDRSQPELAQIEGIEDLSVTIQPD